VVNEDFSFEVYNNFAAGNSLRFEDRVTQAAPSSLDDCKKLNSLSRHRFRYVLIPVPEATPKSKPTSSSLSTPLERAQAWYGLFDLSYASVKARFGLKD